MPNDTTLKPLYEGYVLQADESEEASRLSYDDMTFVGELRLSDKPDITSGDDLNDAPFNCNGGIYDGQRIELKKGDYVQVYRGGIPRHTAPQGHEGRPCEWRTVKSIDKDFNYTYDFHAGLFHEWTSHGVPIIEDAEGFAGPKDSISHFRFTDRAAAVEREVDRG